MINCANSAVEANVRLCDPVPGSMGFPVLRATCAIEAGAELLIYYAKINDASGAQWMRAPA